MSPHSLALCWLAAGSSRRPPPAPAMAGFAAAKILEDILGAYFEDMDDCMLNIFEGHILLQNIEVRAGAIQNALGLPLEVKVGTIGRVELRIPWAKLNSEPTQLLLDDLFIICGPQSESVWVDDVEAERAFQKKQAALASRERQPVPVESQAKETFQTKLTQAVLGRLEVPPLRTTTPLHASLQQPAPSSLQQPAPGLGARVGRECYCRWPSAEVRAHTRSGARTPALVGFGDSGRGVWGRGAAFGKEHMLQIALVRRH